MRILFDEPFEEVSYIIDAESKQLKLTKAMNHFTSPTEINSLHDHRKP